MEGGERRIFQIWNDMFEGSCAEFDDFSVSSNPLGVLKRIDGRVSSVAKCYLVLQSCDKSDCLTSYGCVFCWELAKPLCVE